MPDIEKQIFDREFEKLYEKYYCFLVKYLSGIVHDFDMAEDIAHDVFIRMYKKRGLFFGRQLKRTSTILAPVEQNIICFTGAFFN